MKHLARTLILAVALTLGFALSAHAEGTTGRYPIAIYTEPCSGIVHIDGQRIGPAPITDWVVTEGKHKVSIYRPGKPMVFREINVTKVTGQRFTINLAMCEKCAEKCAAMCAKCADCKKLGKMCPKCAECCKQMCAKCPECQKLCGKGQCPECKGDKKCEDCKSAKSECKGDKKCENCKSAKPECKSGTSECKSTK